MADQIECTALHGEKKMVPVEELIFRPAAYAIIVHENKILLVNTRSTNKLFFPGGAIEKGETPEQALKREVLEEAGIEIQITKLFKVHTSFFYYDPWNKAFHNISAIYTCDTDTTELTSKNNVLEDEAEKPRWIALDEVRPDEFQDWAGEVFTEYLTHGG